MKDAMDSPFPGMDPYVEPHWRDVHARLCTYACDAISAQIAPTMIARLEERVVLEIYEEPGQLRHPDIQVVEVDPFAPSRGKGPVGNGAVAVAEPRVILKDEVPQAFIEIIEPKSGRVLTVIEFLSPTNKLKVGRAKYLKKRAELLRTGASLVEIDLVLAGKPIGELPTADDEWHGPYRVVVSKSWVGDAFDYYALSLRQPLPAIRIPLRKDDEPAVLDIGAMFRMAYRNGSYWATVDYGRPCAGVPSKDLPWVDEMLKAAGKRK